MTTIEQKQSEKAYQKYAWVILFGISLLLTLNILYLFVAPVEEIFEDDTGVAWNAFSTDYPDVASEFLVQQRLLFASFLGVALFAAVTTFGGLRKGQRWAWVAMWVFPATLILTVTVLVLHERLEIGAFYVVFLILSVIGLLLPYRKFFPKH